MKSQLVSWMQSPQQSLSAMRVPQLWLSLQQQPLLMTQIAR